LAFPIRQVWSARRHGPLLARHAAKAAGSVAEPFATSQALGRSDVLTTLRSQGQITRVPEGSARCWHTLEREARVTVFDRAEM